MAGACGGTLKYILTPHPPHGWLYEILIFFAFFLGGSSHSLYLSRLCESLLVSPMTLCILLNFFFRVSRIVNFSHPPPSTHPYSHPWPNHHHQPPVLCHFVHENSTRPLRSLILTVLILCMHHALWLASHSNDQHGVSLQVWWILKKDVQWTLTLVPVSSTIWTERCSFSHSCTFISLAGTCLIGHKMTKNTCLSDNWFSVVGVAAVAGC